MIDGEDGAYGVVFPDLPGCVAMGHTLDEAMVNAEDALQDWMDSMEELGHEIPDPSPLEGRRDSGILPDTPELSP